MISQRKKTVLLGFFFFFFSLSSLSSPLHAVTRGVMLSPTRVVLQDRDRAAVIKLINPDAVTNTYKISLIALQTDEYGNRTEVKNPGGKEAAALKMIRFSPRRATLGSKEWQTVRLMVRKPAHLPPGEYRAHLKAVPIPARVSSPEKGTPQGMSVSLDVLFSVTIPIIIRHGQGTVELHPDPPVLKKRDKTDKYFLETRLNRKGRHSAYFDITAFHTRPGLSESEQIGELKGVAIYPPSPGRLLKIPINIRPDLSGGILELKIMDREDTKAPILGSWSFDLN